MNWNFYRKLHERGVRLEDLAEQLGTSHGHLSQVFNGKRGKNTRKHIAPLLTAEEREILGWDERGNLRVTTPEGVPQGTLSQVETIENNQLTKG